MKSYLVVLAAIAGIAHANEHDPTCPQNGEKMEKGFDDAMRLKFLALHNGYRSRLALGHVSITEESEDYDLYDLLYAPTASKMRYLMSNYKEHSKTVFRINSALRVDDSDFLQKYDCEAEKSAYESAKKCQTTASSWEKYDENLQVIEDPRDINHAALKAIISWATEAFNLNKTGEGVLYRSNHNISNFANLAWDTREKVGCAVVKCSPRTTHVVCHYPKIVKKEGKPIYITGKPCGGCGDYANKFFCHADEGVCIIASRDLDIYGRKKYFYPFREL